MDKPIHEQTAEQTASALVTAVGRAGAGGQQRLGGGWALWSGIILALAVAWAVFMAADLWAHRGGLADGKRAAPWEPAFAVENLVPPGEINRAMPLETAWTDRGLRTQVRPIYVDLGEIRRDPMLQVSLSADDLYRLTFLHLGGRVGQITVRPGAATAGLRVVKIQVPNSAVQAGYDVIQISAAEGDGAYLVGHLILGQGSP